MNHISNDYSNITLERGFFSYYLISILVLLLFS